MIRIHSHFIAERRMHRMFAGQISDRSRRRLSAEVQSCERCADRFRRYYEAEAAVYHTETVLSPNATDRMARGIFETVSSAPSAPRRRAIKTAGAVAAASAAILAVIILALPMLPILPNQRPHRTALPQEIRAASELVSRGHAPTGPATFGIRVFAISKENRGVHEPGTLPLDDILSFTYTRSIPGRGFLAILGIQAEGDVIWYYPDYGEDESIPIDGDIVDEPLGNGFDLSVNHRPGTLYLAALFSQLAIRTKDIETVAKKIQKQFPLPKQLGGRLWRDLEGETAVYEMVFEVEKGNE